MLPFEKENKSRKFCCFVCGLTFEEFDEFKSHIVSEHEEGREYIVCPLKHCCAPVRDMRSHFKAIHKNFPMPQTGMMRALIWKDTSKNKSQGTKTRKPKFKEGYYKSRKMNKELHYRSGYEATLYECLDSDIEVNGFDIEPFEIPYIHQGKCHKYIPDIIVKFIDGHTEVLEIKPANQTTLEKNQDKWAAASKACKTRGWEFVVITEKGIDKWKNKVRLQRGMSNQIFSEPETYDEPLAEDFEDIEM